MIRYSQSFRVIGGGSTLPLGDIKRTQSYERFTNYPNQETIPRLHWSVGTQDATVRIGVYVAMHHCRCDIDHPEVLDWLTPTDFGLVVLVCVEVGRQERRMEVRTTPPAMRFSERRQAIAVTIGTPCGCCR